MMFYNYYEANLILIPENVCLIGDEIGTSTKVDFFN